MKTKIKWMSIGMVISSILILFGCSSNSKGTATVPTKISTNAIVTTASPIIQNQLSPSTIVNKFKSSGIPITNITEYTEETDTNKLLGRPNQYIAKINWIDGRTDGNNECSIEIFKNTTDLALRKTYIDNVTKLMSNLVEYSYVNGNVLLRLPHELTPKDAEGYKTILDK